MLPGLIATSCRRLASRTRGGAARCTRPNLARWVASSHPQTGADCRHRHHRPHYSFDSIGTRLVDIATDRADDVAVVSPRGTRVTYGTLLAHADALADSMRATFARIADEGDGDDEEIKKLSSSPLKPEVSIPSERFAHKSSAI